MRKRGTYVLVFREFCGEIYPMYKEDVSEYPKKKKKKSRLSH